MPGPDTTRQPISPRLTGGTGMRRRFALHMSTAGGAGQTRRRSPNGRRCLSDIPLPFISDLCAQRLRDGEAVPWHQHPRAYAAIVLKGGYEEAGDGGRYRAVAGDVIVHSPYSAHCDRINPSGAVVVNVELPAISGLSLSSGRVADAEKLALDIRFDTGDAVAILAAALVPAPVMNELPDALAAALASNPVIALEPWAEAAGTTARTLRRQFVSAYGVTPKLFRARAKARRAWEQITRTDEAFAVIAHEAGFADQAHMSRAIRWLTGRRPTDWRLADAFKTAGLEGG